MSPARTVWLRAEELSEELELEESEELELEELEELEEDPELLEEDPELLEEPEPPPGMRRDWPTRIIAFEPRLFAEVMELIETPYRRARSETVSPARTVWLRAEAEPPEELEPEPEELELAELEPEEDPELLEEPEPPPGMRRDWPTRITAFESRSLAETTAATVTLYCRASAQTVSPARTVWLRAAEPDPEPEVGLELFAPVEALAESDPEELELAEPGIVRICPIRISAEELRSFARAIAATVVL